MKNKEIFDLWQNPYHNNVLINFYNIVNSYLRKELNENDITKDILNSFNIKTYNEFIIFLNTYIKNLKNIIYKNKNTHYTILYRGEHRKKFNFNKNDIIVYNNFHSTTDNIYIAYGFSQNLNDNFQRILFIIYYPKNSVFKKLYNKMTVYNDTENITETINENEYLIPPNSYYQILHIEKIYNNVIVVKMQLLLQDKNNNEFILQPKNLKIFNDKNFIELKKLSVNYKNEIKQLTNFKKYTIHNDLYELLFDENNNNVLLLDLNKIIKNIDSIDDKNIKTILNNIKKLGIGYYDYDLVNPKNYIKKIKTIKLLKNIEFNKFTGILYSGFFNVDNVLQKYEFIQIIENNNSGIFDKIIKTKINDSYYLYDDLHNNIFPTGTLQKNNKKITQYFKYVIKFIVKNIEIVVCKNIEHFYQSFILLVSKFNFNILSKKKFKNKFNFNCIFYEIEIF